MVIGFASREYSIGYLQIFSSLNIKSVIQILIETFQFMDIYLWR